MSKLAMRRAWFQVHKWIGLILAILIIPISLTGSALVWHDALDRTVNPARFATSGTTVLEPSAYVAAAKLAPGERIASLRVGEESGDPVVVSAAAVGKGDRPGPPMRTNYYFDPPTAKLLDSAGSNSGLVRVLHGLHGSLLVPGIGRQIVGWIGVAMMLSCFTGLWLWWPTVGKWVRGLRWRRHPNLDTNLHHQMGFWIAVPLFVLSLTGVWISFPQFFGALSGANAQRGPAGPDRRALMRARPLETTVTSLGEVVAAARAETPGSVRQVTWPTDLKAEWAITLKPAEGPPQNFTVNDETGAIEGSAASQRPGGIARTMRQVHDGTDMGFVWQFIIFLGGILPAILAVTGIIMWWRARGWKADIKAKRQARAVPTE